MLDYRFIKENLQVVQDNIALRSMTTDAAEVVRLYDTLNALNQKIEKLRRKRNENTKAMKSGLEPEKRQVLIEIGRRLKEDIAASEAEAEGYRIHLEDSGSRIPNRTHPDAPVGKEDKDNVVLRQVGEKPEFDFPVLDHLELAESLDLVNFETAAKVAGSKFYYLRNQAVFLELALTRFALDILQKHDFTPMLTPDIAREEIAAGIGFQPRGEESNTYVLENTNTCLVGTAEITLGGYHAGEILDISSKPVFLAGLSHCFRREAGAAGQYSRGLYRVHQFTKVEMFAYCREEDSEKLHQKLLSIEEEIFSSMGLPYRVVDICTGDMGAPAYRKFDLEVWMPGRDDWGEVTSVSNCTDFQSRRLGIRYRDENGKMRFAHTLNGTAIAVSRAIVALLENGQQANGSVRIPSVLVPYCGFSIIEKGLK